MPLTCPSPPGIQPPDCPLYEQRLAYGPDEPLRRAILMERHGPDLAALVRAEPAPEPIPVEGVLAETSTPPGEAILPPLAQAALPAPEPVPVPNLNQFHKERI